MHCLSRSGAKTTFACCACPWSPKSASRTLQMRIAPVPLLTHTIVFAASCNGAHVRARAHAHTKRQQQQPSAAVGSQQPSSSAPAEAAVAAAAASAAAAAPPQQQQQSDYFLEPLLRSFLLGVGAGAAVEATHVLFKALSIAVATGPQVLDALPGALPDFAPLMVWDHAVAVGAWVLLYVAEAVAILSVLNQCGGDAAKAVRLVAGLVAGLT